MSVQDFLFADPLSGVNRDLTASEVKSRFGGLIPEGLGADLGILGPFVTDRPWRYWTDSVLRDALDLLENDVGRTYSAISVRESELNRAIHVLFNLSSVVLNEEFV